MSNKHNEEITELIATHRKQLNSFQQQWQLEGENFLKEINQLKKTKVDLQVEIGTLLRGNREAEVNLAQTLQRLDVQRDKFRKEILGV